jgi:hypothetical protein
LQIDEYKLLLDCGWNELFEPERLELLAKYVWWSPPSVPRWFVITDLSETLVSGVLFC